MAKRVRPVLRVMLGAWALLSTGSCEPKDTGEAAAESGGSDSLGWSATLSADPTLEIGVGLGDAEYQLTDVVSTWRAADGRILVADRGTQEIRAFGTDGAFQYAFGGEGEGPGEFRLLGDASPYRGDSIAVWDPRLLRISIFGLDGEFGRSVHPEDPPDLREIDRASTRGVIVAARFWGVLEDGSFVLSPQHDVALDQNDSEALQLSLEYPVWVYTASGIPLEHLGDFVGPDVWQPSAEVRGAAGPDVRMPTAAYPRTFDIHTHEDRIYIAGSPTFEIQVRTSGGGAERVIRGPELDLAVDAAAREAFQEQARNRAVEDGPIPPAFERALESVSFPETMAPYSRVLVDALDHLWVREHRIPGAGGPKHWWVFDPNDRLLGTVETPGNVEIREIGADYVLGTHEDALEIPRLRIYRLRKDESPL